MKAKHHLLSATLLIAIDAAAQGSMFDIPTVESYGLHGNVKEASSVGYLIEDDDRRYRTYYTYNDDGLLATMSYDNKYIIYAYDIQKRLTKQLLKEDRSESITTYIRDAYGKQLQFKAKTSSSTARTVFCDDIKAFPSRRYAK